MKIVRRISAVAAAMLITLGIALSPAAPASAAGFFDENVEPAYLQNSEAGLCMDDYALSGSVYQYPCNAQDNEWWKWRKPFPSSGNVWHIGLGVGRYSPHKCLYPEGVAYYSRITLRICNNLNTRQQWAEHKVGNFSYFESLYAPGKCIGALVGPSISEMVLAECVVRPSILFKKVLLSQGPPPPGRVWG
ncbi:hypothetical protein ACQPZX_34735 [Actinoplanes sp. CA-142083]|uniref:hypothetical protein n=1 Tax=Actinoplanes sp. CA-142083 TaxID=3239903 RepID=UPI003D9277DB